jgi:hypothetical protein
MTKTASIINLVIIGIAIILVISIKSNKTADQFSQNNSRYNVQNGQNGQNNFQNGQNNFQNPYNVYQSGNWVDANSSYQNMYQNNYQNPYQYMPGRNYQEPNAGPIENLKEQPMLSTYQMYPRDPYSSDAGSECNTSNQCGAMGTCVNGVCQVKNYNGSVFNIPV